MKKLIIPISGLVLTIGILSGCSISQFNKSAVSATDRTVRYAVTGAETVTRDAGIMAVDGVKATARGAEAVVDTSANVLTGRR